MSRIRRQRRIDCCAYIIRHDDGIKDIVASLKNKCVEFIKRFSSMPAGKKIAFILSKIAQAAGAVLTGMGTADIVKEAKRVKALNQELQTGWENFASFMGYDEADDTLSAPEQLKGKYLKAGIKLISGLCMAVVGTVASARS